PPVPGGRVFGGGGPTGLGLSVTFRSAVRPRYSVGGRTRRRSGLASTPGRGVGMGRHACPSADELGRLLGDGMGAAERGRGSDHVEGCAACQGRLDALLADDAVAPLTRAAGAAAEAGPDQAFLTNLRQLVSQAAQSSGGLGSSGRAGRDRAEASPSCPAAI